MTQQPLFSVLIANYNNGKYLQEAIDSVLAQTYTNWEIIIVDDGSSDQSQEIYEQLKLNRRIHIYMNDTNRGCGFSKRLCVDKANGEICGFLDADDVLLSDALQNHVIAHANHHEASCIFSRYYCCDDNLNILYEQRQLTIPEGESYFTHRDYDPEHFTSFKRSRYILTEGISPDIPAGVDQDLYFKLEETGPVFILDKFTYKYRIYTGYQRSLGDRGINAFYWNLIVRHNTCLRRNLNPQLYTVLDLKDYIGAIQYCLDTSENQIQQIKKSRAYRLGNLLTRPLHIFRKIMSNQ